MKRETAKWIASIAIFKINLTIKKLPKLDELGILG